MFQSKVFFLFHFYCCRHSISFPVPVRFVMRIAHCPKMDCCILVFANARFPLISQKRSNTSRERMKRLMWNKVRLWMKQTKAAKKCLQISILEFFESFWTISVKEIIVLAIFLWHDSLQKQQWKDMKTKNWLHHLVFDVKRVWLFVWNFHNSYISFHNGTLPVATSS